MKYTLEYLEKGSLVSHDGIVKNEAELETLMLKLDAEKYVNLCFVFSNQNILTVSGGREQYIVMFSDNSKFYELNNPINRGGDLVLIRTGHTVGKFPKEMVMDPFTTLGVIKEFYHSGKRHPDHNWKPLN
ncbi:MAG: hypothetical protein JNM24_15725 [Bdellovibrionaceae bacterium]|jgi:hypothetical protein|nr:hypothetical protein [Pseudobdellovibrionaceae bacterium]